MGVVALCVVRACVGEWAGAAGRGVRKTGERESRGENTVGVGSVRGAARGMDGVRRNEN